MNYDFIALMWLFREFGPTSTIGLFKKLQDQEVRTQIRKLDRLQNVLFMGVGAYQTRLVKPAAYEVAATVVFFPKIVKLVDEGMLEVCDNDSNNIEAEVDPSTYLEIMSSLAATTYRFDVLPSTNLQITKLYNSFKNTFDISLTKILFYAKPAIDAYPIWGDAIHQRQDQWPNVFVAMPFHDELRPIYTDCIAEVANEMKLTCKRADDFSSSNSIIEEIWSSIYHAQLCIIDCTGRNANVFYELGIAHTLGRKTLLIAKTIEDIPFDVRHLRTLIYGQDREAFKNQLRATIKRELALENG